MIFVLFDCLFREEKRDDDRLDVRRVAHRVLQADAEVPIVLDGRDNVEAPRLRRESAPFCEVCAD
jgi:hypothetical protein